MLGDISRVDHIYLACGYTDLRRGIDGLAQIVQQQFELDPFSNSLFLFCGKRRIESRPCCGRETDLFCCISEWRMAEDFNGPAAVPRCVV